MADLTTNYLGLSLKNPFIVGSCSLTSNIEDIIKLEEAGAAAVVLKSVFEEEILFETGKDLDQIKNNRLIYDQLENTQAATNIYTKGERLEFYIRLIQEAKARTGIPVIASINCISDTSWIDFTTQIQAAGADALELNISMNPIDCTNTEKEKTIIRILKKVLKTVTIPVSVKISDRYSNLAITVDQLIQTGISGLVLFNRFYSPDIDIYNCRLVQGRMHSGDTEYQKPLRWIALLSDKISCSLAASSGIHDAYTAIKMMLAGANAVQVVSALYLNRKDYLIQMLRDYDEWMTDKGFFSVEQFIGKASYKNVYDPKIYERAQFMKYYGKIDI